MALEAGPSTSSALPPQGRQPPLSPAINVDFEARRRRRSALRDYKVDPSVKLRYEEPSWLLNRGDFFGEPADTTGARKLLPPRPLGVSRTQHIHNLNNYVGIGRVKKRRDFGLDALSASFMADDLEEDAEPAESNAHEMPDTDRHSHSEAERDEGSLFHNPIIPPRTELLHESLADQIGADQVKEAEACVESVIAAFDGGDPATFQERAEMDNLRASTPVSLSPGAPTHSAGADPRVLSEESEQGQSPESPQGEVDPVVLQAGGASGSAGSKLQKEKKKKNTKQSPGAKRDNGRAHGRHEPANEQLHAEDEELPLMQPQERSLPIHAEASPVDPAHLLANHADEEAEDDEAEGEEEDEAEGEEAESEHQVEKQVAIASRAQKSRGSKRKYNARNSLGGFGTRMEINASGDVGLRRSTRRRFRPLEYWRNEHAVYGRSHRSLPTIVRVEMMQSLPEWPKVRGQTRNNVELLQLDY